jgi:hypothetical protein
LPQWVGRVRRTANCSLSWPSTGFEALITTDRNLRHQQNLAMHGVAAVTLLAVSNRLADLLPLVPKAEAALENLKPGMIVEIIA